jgi:hypothetical protein
LVETRTIRGFPEGYEQESPEMALDDDDEQLEGEISISFAPRFDELTRLGIAPDQFEAALVQALEDFETLSAREDFDAENLDLESIELKIGGASYRLGDLAEIEFGEEFGDEDEEYLDDEEDEEDEDEA